MPSPPSLRKVHLALIGLGNIARKHAEVARELPGVSLVAGIKRDAITGEAFCREFQIPHYYRSVTELLEWGEFDAAVVCCGHQFTVEIASALLASGRPCLVEKPVGFSATETGAVADIASLAGTWGMVGVNRRYYSNVRKALEMMEAAGGLLALQVEQPEWIHQSDTWGLPPDVLDRYFLVNGIHLIDLMCHAAGMPEQVSAIARTRDARRNSYDAFFRFPGNVPGHYSAQWYAPGRWKMDLFAEALRIRFSGLENAQYDRTGAESGEVALDECDVRFKPGFFGQMRAFTNAVANGTPPPPPACLLGEAKAIMKVMDQIWTA